MKTQTLKEALVSELCCALSSADRAEWAQTVQHAANATGLALKALAESGDLRLVEYIETALTALAQHRGQLAGQLFEAVRRERGDQ